MIRRVLYLRAMSQNIPRYNVKIGSARYRDDQYTIYKERSGKRSRFARLHYDEHDVPYLDVIWTLNEVDNRETVDDE